jgi:hypothetical protein
MANKSGQKEYVRTDGFIMVAPHCQGGPRNEACGGHWGNPYPADNTLAVCEICSRPVVTQAHLDSLHAQFQREAGLR